jgi:putative restriction endonuclease
MSIPDFYNHILNLHVDFIGKGSDRHERPHKPIMMLVVMDLIEDGSARVEHIEWTQKLRTRFAEYFEIVKAANDNNTPENPFSESFWKCFRVHSDGNVRELEKTPLVSDCDTGKVFASLDSGLQELYDPKVRERVRSRIIGRYFPHHRYAITQLLGSPLDLAVEEESKDPKRSEAFRSTIMNAYDYQCAACGLRIYIPDQKINFVDAAHIIPFSVQYNDLHLYICRHLVYDYSYFYSLVFYFLNCL